MYAVYVTSSDNFLNDHYVILRALITMYVGRQSSRHQGQSLQLNPPIPPLLGLVVFGKRRYGESNI